MTLACGQALACDCPRVKEENWLPGVKKNINRTEFIFLGEVIRSNEKTFTLKVIDAFKGDIKADSILTGDSQRSGCLIIPNEGFWIIYANSVEGKLIEISLCGISRELTGLTTSTPPLVLEKASNASIDYEEYQNLHQITLVKNWVNEYALLTAYRNRQQKKVQPVSSKDYLAYLAIGLSAMAIVLSVVSMRRR
ncbi:hypothetical protein GCM10023183_34710 [Nibribacter koreensis]|uniref:Tissue inhibitor of metalloproteinase n=2 Tax=Nibribacter koreensis TaxID=1084519 RepID=A0ABP8FZX5_9BACT